MPSTFPLNVALIPASGAVCSQSLVAGNISPSVCRLQSDLCCSSDKDVSSYIKSHNTDHHNSSDVPFPTS
jgi:hypothetical protein